VSILLFSGTVLLSRQIFFLYNFFLTFFHPAGEETCNVGVNYLSLETQDDFARMIAFLSGVQAAFSVSMCKRNVYIENSFKFNNCKTEQNIYQVKCKNGYDLF